MTALVTAPRQRGAGDVGRGEWFVLDVERLARALWEDDDHALGGPDSYRAEAKRIANEYATADPAPPPENQPPANDCEGLLRTVREQETWIEHVKAVLALVGPWLAGPVADWVEGGCREDVSPPLPPAELWALTGITE